MIDITYTPCVLIILNSAINVRHFSPPTNYVATKQNQLRRRFFSSLALAPFGLQYINPKTRHASPL